MLLVRILLGAFCIAYIVVSALLMIGALLLVTDLAAVVFPYVTGILQLWMVMTAIASVGIVVIVILARME